jgi:hypothetical protein
LTYDSAPQAKIFVLIIVEVCPSPPFNIIMSGVEVQFEFYAVFRKGLAKIADQIPGTGMTRNNLINYFVRAWKIEFGVGSRKYDIASTDFIDHIGKTLSVEVPDGLTVPQRTSPLWLALARPVHHQAVLGRTIQSVDASWQSMTVKPTDPTTRPSQFFLAPYQWF